MKKTNGYLIADFAALITIILILVSAIYKNSPKYFLSAMTVSVLSALIQAKFGKAQIINKTGKAICSKDEYNSTTSAISADGNKNCIDGVKIDGIVYKIPNGVHAIATEQNRIKVNSIIGNAIYHIGGGLLTTPPDDSWNALFESDC
ncbi:MAG: hypothetical protein PHU62_06890 [Bacteroidales bacterium]|jgi:hypothetical protein|nr:hypothetical protein [Bacteroidales bacterium]MDD2205474.1 hypothetical protein [Bacteroidales bacterium]MDD3914451.1 hypothetical protein [Bacteroidales bacterium]MDD4634279.1 hypothetical protein [Bacteroidales bacterium]